MFDIGWTELLLIGVLILFLFGPEDIPKIMYNFGRIMKRFKYMKYALSLVLVFIGCKVFYNEFVSHIPPLLSLAITVGTLIAGALFSLIKTRNDEPAS